MVLFPLKKNSSRLSNIGANSITTDAAGNITADVTRTYVIDAAGRLEQVKISGSTVGAYIYNANNQRTQKTASSIVTHYVYGLGGLLYGEYDNTGALIREYVYLNGSPLAQVESGEVLAYIHTDHLGTPRYATDSNGAQVWAWGSDAFGNGTPSGTATVNLRFAGQYWDAESDLHYNWNRYYDPITGRYISSDPIGLAGGLNTFGYALANPVMYIDPRGLSIKKAIARVIPGLGQACNIYDAATILTACALDPRFCKTIAQEVLTGLPNTEAEAPSSKPKSDGSNVDPKENEGGKKPNTGNADLDEVLGDSVAGDTNKGWKTPGTKEGLEEAIANIPGAEESKKTSKGGTSTTLPGGIKIDVYPKRGSDGLPGWSVTNPSGNNSGKGSIGDY